VNVPGIVGFAKAFELAVSEMDVKSKRLSSLRDRMEKSLEEMIPNIIINCRGCQRLWGTSNISFPGVDGEALLIGMNLEGIAASSGSACATGTINPSHVLLAMGIHPQVAQTSIRFSMGLGTSDDAIDHVIDVVPRLVERLRKVSGKA
jgi:cysteine desulfurase